MMATADIVNGAPVVVAGLTNRTAGSSNRRGAGTSQSFSDHIATNGSLDLEVGRPIRGGHPRALARGVGQRLPGLVRPAKLEDADANHQNNRQRDCRFEENRAALLPGTTRGAGLRHLACLSRGVLA
jgi:hypothetical protein